MMVFKINYLQNLVSLWKPAQLCMYCQGLWSLYKCVLLLYVYKVYELREL